MGTVNSVVSGEQISVSINPGKDARRAPGAAAPHKDFESGDAVFSWDEAAAAARRDARALAAQPAARTQQLDGDFLAAQGVNTGEPHADDQAIAPGASNPSHALIAAGRLVPDLVPAAPAGGGQPPQERGKLDALGVNTGSAHTQWDDAQTDPVADGLEGPYSLGPSPNRERNSPSHRAGGIFARAPRPQLAQLEQQAADAAADAEDAAADAEEAKGKKEARVVYQRWARDPAAAAPSLAGAEGAAGGAADAAAQLRTLGDEMVPAGEQNPAHLIQPDPVPSTFNAAPATAAPLASRSRLNALGVNTGEEAEQDDDRMSDAAALERPYALGSSPARERASPVGRLSGARAAAARAGQALASAERGAGAGAHTLFQAEVLPRATGSPRAARAVAAATAAAAGSAGALVAQARRALAVSQREAAAASAEQRRDLGKERAAEAAEAEAVRVGAAQQREVAARRAVAAEEARFRRALALADAPATQQLRAKPAAMPATKPAAKPTAADVVRADRAAPDAPTAAEAEAARKESMTAARREINAYFDSMPMPSGGHAPHKAAPKLSAAQARKALDAAFADDTADDHQLWVAWEKRHHTWVDAPAARHTDTAYEARKAQEAKVDAARRAREAAEAWAAEEAAKHDEADSFAKWSAKHGTVSDQEVRKVAHKDFAAWASEHNVDTSPLPSAAGRKSHHDAHEEFKRQYWAAKELRQHAARVAARQASGGAAADGVAGSFDVKQDGSDLEFKAPGGAALSQLHSAKREKKLTAPKASFSAAEARKALNAAFAAKSSGKHAPHKAAPKLSAAQARKALDAAFADDTADDHQSWVAWEKRHHTWVDAPAARHTDTAYEARKAQEAKVDAARRAREAAEAWAAEEAVKHDEADSFAKWSAKHGTVSDQEVLKVAHKDFAAWASEHNVDTSPLPSAAGRKSHHDAHEEFKRQYWAAKELRQHAARVAARQASGGAAADGVAADGVAGSFDVKQDGSDLEFKAPGGAALSQLSAVGAPKAAPLQHMAAVGGGDGSFVSRLERRVAAMPAVPESVLCRLSFWGVRPLCPAGTSPA